MANENSAIWRVTTTAVSEASVSATEIISFNESPISTGGKNIMMSDINWRGSLPENERIGGDINNVQDMGLDGIDYLITTNIKDSTGVGTTNALVILRNWMRQAKKDSTHPFGRFGLRMDDMPQFNVIPSSTYALILNGIHPIRDPNKGREVAGVAIQLRFSGDPAGLGA